MAEPVLRFKDNQGREFPAWEEKKLGELGTFYSGLSGKTKADFGNGNSSFIPYMNIYKNPFAKSDKLEKVAVKETEKQNRVKYGDLLFTQSSETVEEIGLSSVWTGQTTPYLNSFCFGFRPNNFSITDPLFLGHLMRADIIRKQIMLEGQGISRINLSPNRLKQVKLPLPVLAEQRKIADFLGWVDREIEVEEQRLETMKAIKRGLLQQMFI